MEKNRSPAWEMAKDFLMIGEVFAAAIAGFLILAVFFVPWEVGVIIYSLFLLINIGMATTIAVGIMLLLIALGGRFFRLL